MPSRVTAGLPCLPRVDRRAPLAVEHLPAEAAQQDDELVGQLLLALLGAPGHAIEVLGRPGEESRCVLELLVPAPLRGVWEVVAELGLEGLLLVRVVQQVLAVHEAQGAAVVGQGIQLPVLAGLHFRAPLRPVLRPVGRRITGDVVIQRFHPAIPHELRHPVVEQEEEVIAAGAGDQFGDELLSGGGVGSVVHDHLYTRVFLAELRCGRVEVVLLYTLESQRPYCDYLGENADGQNQGQQ
jgi:hypothetical protein